MVTDYSGFFLRFQTTRVICNKYYSFYIFIVSICIGYVIKENEIVKNDIKCLFEGKTRRSKRTLEGEFLNGFVLQFSVPKLKIWKISQFMSTISTLILFGRQN
jgi:hypothetical protein